MGSERGGPRPEDWPFTFELLDVNWLYVDERYQRPLTGIHRRIAQNLDLTLLDPLIVSRHEEHRYAIADGQNRWQGCRVIGVRWLWCRVLDLTPQEEARVFSKLQSERKNISPLERYKADVFAGDPAAVAVDRLLKRHSIVTSDTSGAWSPEDGLSAISTVRELHGRFGDEHMDWVLECIRAGFAGQRGRYSSEVIASVSAYRVKDPDANQRRMIVALAEAIGTPGELKIRSASKRRGGTGLGGGSFKYSAIVVEDAYRAVGRGLFRQQWEDTQLRIEDGENA